jgi:hypothetical protein
VRGRQGAHTGEPGEKGADIPYLFMPLELNYDDFLGSRKDSRPLFARQGGQFIEGSIAR